MGALENMQEEIIPLVPALLLLGAGIGVDGVVVVAMSAGAAMVGSAFGPTNPFQAGIALKLAQLPPLSAGGLRLGMFAAGFVLWVGWTMRYAARGTSRISVGPPEGGHPALQPEGGHPVTQYGASGFPSTPLRAGSRTSSPSILAPRHLLVLALVLAPMAAYVYGALRLDWGFNELSGAFVIGAAAAGLVGGLGVAGTVTTYVEGMQNLLPAALMVGTARAISVVLSDGHVVDTILHGLVSPLATVPALATAVLMIPVQGLIHVIVPSVSGQAVLTMPLFAPLADVLHLSRQVPVLAYQTGAGLMELATPTNGALMAVLVAAGVPLNRWLRFAAGGLILLTLVGLIGVLIV